MKTQRAVSFDESSMESCSTALPDERSRESCGSCESFESSANNCISRLSGVASTAAATTTTTSSPTPQNLQEVTSLEEAKCVIAALRARQRAQAHQMLAWRRTLKLQEELVARLTREKAEQLRSLSSQLLLFESRLCRKQKEIEASLAQRESMILKQQRIIEQLQSKLKLATERSGRSAERAGGSPPACDALDRLDSLGDADSAVVLEDNFLDEPALPRFRSSIVDVTLIRSVSDAVEPPANNKYGSSQRRCNGYLRRPEVLETVYSVEEDADADGSRAAASADEEEAALDEEAAAAAAAAAAGTQRHSSDSAIDRPKLRDLYGSFERLAQQEDAARDSQAAGALPGAQRSRDESQQAQVTYNRVMSNHRSVTKPKDVKYKRINKAKSKSLEELRGRLRNWVEKGNKIAISLDQSYA
ncbi:uncharacterized protein LOC131668761 [Phymastichus coffea]|uniref:uncharacterized protein LOC131668761 n=1 Tax=Phymastichus coffea TaxID=108790 RepID=UPI00273B361F|nr:uncharacterized protein LOC131668761 [Phymastichus coffea]